MDGDRSVICTCMQTFMLLSADVYNSYFGKKHKTIYLLQNQKVVDTDLRVYQALKIFYIECNTWHAKSEDYVLCDDCISTLASILKNVLTFQPSRSANMFLDRLYFPIMFKWKSCECVGY